MTSQRIYRWAAVAFAVLIALGSMLRRTVTAGLQTNGAFHPLAHILLYTAFTALLMKTTRSRGLRALICLCAALLGYGTEWYEHLTDGFPVEQMDVVADCAGVGVALLLSLAAGWRRQRASKPA